MPSSLRLVWISFAVTLIGVRYAKTFRIRLCPIARRDREPAATSPVTLWEHNGPFALDAYGQSFNCRYEKSSQMNSDLQDARF